MLLHKLLNINRRQASRPFALRARAVQTFARFMVSPAPVVLVC
jgi:hypothetical protein